MGWVRITVEDLDTGESEAIEIENDYVLTCVGDCYLDATQVFPTTGTHVLTVKNSNGKKRAVPSREQIAGEDANKERFL